MEELRQSFSAPMGKSTVAMTIAASAILIGVGILQLSLGMKRNGPGRTALIVAGSAMLAGFAGSVFFKIRGYDLTPSHLVVRYGFSGTSFPLREIAAVDIKPDALRKSTRSAANGGMWSFLGSFTSPEHGEMRVYVSDTQRTVILTMPQQKVVVSPDDPERFVRAIESMKGRVG
jgi:hypothetical protein